LFAAVLLAGGFLVVRGHWRRLSATNRNVSSLAVLPLRNLSGDSDQEYFSEGVTDELITDLAKITRLRVISHTSVEHYKNTNETLPEIARELGVDAIVEGTIMRAGGRVRITAQLIDARRDQHLWADSYERDLRDVLELQGDVAKQIAKEIGIQLSSTEETRLGRTERSVDPSAHEAYLKGVFFFDLASCRDFENALSYFQRSITRDPSFAPAYAGMADAYFSIGDWRCWHVPPFEKAQAMALKAIELEPSNARAHAVLAKVGFARDWNRVGPAQQFTLALDLDPNDASIHSYYGNFLVAIGQQEAGLAEERKAQELDPLSEKTNDNYTWTLYLAHRFDAAVAIAKHSLSVTPAYGQYYWMGQCYERKGLPDQAIEYYLKAFSGMPEELPFRRAAFQKGGLKGYWQEDERLRRRRQEEIDAVYEAMYYAHEGENDKAIEQLQLAYQQHSDGLQYLKVEPVYDGLRDDPRFKELVAKVGL
jgi:TolB-like protein/Tfp pilus assembly protein PilF